MKKSKKELCLNIPKRQYNRDGEDRIIVDMNVKDDTDFLSVYSTNETPVISNEVAEFLENSTRSIRADEQLTLRVKSDCIDETEKKVYKAAIKEYYTERYHENERELKAQNRIALLLLIVGVLVLASALLWEYKIGNILWAEVVDVVAWVFLWEAVDIKFFKTRELARQRKRCLALISMKIEYERIS